MAKKKRQPSLQEQLDAMKETLDEIRGSTVDDDGAPSLPPGSLQRGIENAARSAGLDGSGAWGLTKDIGRAFVPQKIETLARNKLRGEDYDDANAKAEESREDLETRRPGLQTAGAAVQSLAGTVAGIALYAKLANRGGTASSGAQAATAATHVSAPVPAPAAPSRVGGLIKGGGKLALVAGAGAAIGAYLTSGAKAKAEAPAERPAGAAGSPQGSRTGQQGGPITIPAHTRADGTQVKEHTRQRR